VEGRVADAEDLLDQGLEVFPGNPILLNDRGMTKLLSGNLPGASSDFEAALAADPVDADFVANAALGAALGGDEKRAIKLWSRVLPPADVDRNLAIARAARSRFTTLP
jgi:Flp pilus assembly protein TadD